MKEIVKADYPFEHSMMDLDEAIGYFGDKEQTYKLDLLNGLAALRRISVDGLGGGGGVLAVAVRR